MATAERASSANDRQELAHFLRSRRERIDPTGVGLPPRTHRRTPGLRREDISVLAGVSPTWYAYLEQGRDINPSPALLDSIARVLRCSEQERQYMHRLAYQHPTMPPRPDLSTMVAAIRELVATFERVEYPVYAFDDVGDLITWNPATVDWYGDFADVKDRSPNMLVWFLTSKTVRDRILGWAEDCRDLVARYRSFVAGRRHDSRIARFIEYLGAESPEFDQWWNEHEVHGQVRRMRVFRHPQRGIRRMYIQVLTPTESDAIMVAFHIPVEDAGPVVSVGG